MKYLFLTLILFITKTAIGGEMNLEKRIECGVKSAIKFDIPADILLAISTIENGSEGVVYKNSNGSLDYGVMQINSVYIQELAEKHNMIVRPVDLLASTCYSFEIAAFKVSNHLKNDRGSFLERIANYHSRTKDLNRYYQTLLIEHSSKWRKLFESRDYVTYFWDFKK